MARVCATCSNKEGPFSPIQIFFDTVYVCKNTKSAPTRVVDCVERRRKADNDKYKEQLDAYA